LKRGFWLNVARIVVSAGLLAWALSRVQLGDLGGMLREADLGLLLLAVGLSVAGMWIRTWRWQVLLEAAGARLPFRRLVYLNFVGQFFSSFLPTGLAGDVVRVLDLGEGASSTQAAGTVLLDRLTGFLGLFLLALAVLPFSGGLIPAQWAWSLAGLSAAVIVGSLVLFEGRLLRKLTGWLPGGLSLASGSWLARAYDVITACGARGLLAALGIATLFNLEQIGFNLVLAAALGIRADALYFALFIPIATMALVVPISIAGLGVREQIYLTLFASPAVGLSPAQALALSLGAYGLDLVNGLAGGVLYFGAGALGLRKKEPQMNTDEHG
jgi:glycosyltransferase 2 family protein